MSVWMNLYRLWKKRSLQILILTILLLIYFVLNASQSKKINSSFENDFDDIDDVEIDGDGSFDNDNVDNYTAKSSGKSLLWRMEVMNDIGNADSIEILNLLNNNEGHSNNSSKSCVNSAQGKLYITDDKGYVCTRKELLPNGCCDEISLTNSTNRSNNMPYRKNSRYSCKFCNPKGCCSIFEYCVSCCLDPNKINENGPHTYSLRKKVQKLRKGQDVLKLRLQNLDSFQICLAACRTSSASVQHENQYKDSLFKYCYTLQLHNTQSKIRQRRNLKTTYNNTY